MLTEVCGKCQSKKCELTLLIKKSAVVTHSIQLEIILMFGCYGLLQNMDVTIVLCRSFIKREREKK